VLGFKIKQTQKQTRQSNMFKAIKIILSVLIALMVTVFAVKNSHVVAIDLWPLPLQFKLTLSLVLIGTFAVGALSGGLLVWISQISKRFLKNPEKISNPSLPQDLN
jgi:uncharacterized integral membrane protein